MGCILETCVLSGSLIDFVDCFRFVLVGFTTFTGIGCTHLLPGDFSGFLGCGFFGFCVYACWFCGFCGFYRFYCSFCLAGVGVYHWGFAVQLSFRVASFSGVVLGL